jgi:diadenosine tetraphosphate (Ap4A) HIT family hydrolase
LYCLPKLRIFLVSFNTDSRNRNAMFKLDPLLNENTYHLGEFSLSLLLLAEDANYPWCILVPKRAGIREIHQLNKEDRAQLLEESCCLSQAMESLFNPSKMNVAALGNMVPQLHVHHIARFDDDPAWPNPIWGAVSPITYKDVQLNTRMDDIKGELTRQGAEFMPKK